MIVRAEAGEAFDAPETELGEAVCAALTDSASGEIERRVAEGRPAVVQVEESGDADPIVVGSRGHGGFAELLLGSVSQQAARHADPPAVVVRREIGGR